MSFKKAFLPVGLVLAIVLALLFPTPGVWMDEAHMISVFVIIIFFFNGWQFKMSDSRLGGHFIAAFIVSVLISLFIGPVLGLLAANVFTSNPLMSMGLIIMSSVPVTLSTAIVLSEISGGNRAWALIMTIGMNLLGIFTMPFMVKIMLSGADGLEVSATALLWKLITLVLIPFVVGLTLRRLLRKIKDPTFFGYIPSTCVILTVYAAFATARDALTSVSWQTYPSIALASLSIHLILMALAFGYALGASLKAPERNTLLFIASQKTLPLAISVIVVVAPESALAIVPCLIFHFIQLFLDSFIAAHLGPSVSKA